MVKNGMTLTYDEWLAEVLNPRSRHKVAKGFWARHRHEQQLDRWVSVVGPERMAVVVVSDTDRTALPRAFEGLLGLSEGTLAADDVRDNRGLTAAEIEAIRQLNVVFEQRGWSPELYHQVVRRGCILPMQTRTPDPDEARIETPPELIAVANEIAAAAASHIGSAGALVVGDLATLSSVPAQPAAAGSSNQQIPMSASDLAVAGARERIDRLLAMSHEASRVETLGPMSLAGVVARRVRRRAVSKLRRTAPSTSSDGSFSG